MEAVGRELRTLVRQVAALDLAAYEAIATTPTPDLDRALGRLSRLADHSAIWGAAAAMLALTGPRGRRAGRNGLAAVAVTSTVINALVKPLGRRRRPDRDAGLVQTARHVAMPRSTSFPSGHAGSAFAFASGVARVWPAAAWPLWIAATLVAYSRVHTGVHYPGDVIVGVVLGNGIGSASGWALHLPDLHRPQWIDLAGRP